MTNTIREIHAQYDALRANSQKVAHSLGGFWALALSRPLSIPPVRCAPSPLRGTKIHPNLLRYFSFICSNATRHEIDARLDALSPLVAGATVVAYGDLPLALPGVASVSFGEPLAHPARGIPAIAICQLLSYHKSFLTGADPDKPDGLSPWIKL